jgi:tRNA(Ile)-lysidine synthase
VIRPIASGDRFIPFGCHGHTTVQKFLIDKKIPLSQRNQIKVLCIDDEIIWIPGLRRSEIGRIKEDTQQIIKLTIKSEALSYGTNKQNGCN